jgi:hypothetical protein
MFSMILPGVHALWLRQRPFLAGVIVGLLAAGYLVVISLSIWDWRHPRLQVRKKLPRPEIALNLDLKGPENIRNQR